MTEALTPTATDLPPDPEIVRRGADATHFNGQDAAFAAWLEVTHLEPEWAFRVRSGANPGQYRVEAFKLGSYSTGWVRWVA